MLYIHCNGLVQIFIKNLAQYQRYCVEIAWNHAISTYYNHYKKASGGEAFTKKLRTRGTCDKAGAPTKFAHSGK